MAEPIADPLDSDATEDASWSPAWDGDDDALYPADPPGGLSALQEAATAWVRENQTVAMITGFALGVLAGALLRD